MFAESEKNRLLAGELLRIAHRVWVEDTDLVLSPDGRRRQLTGRLLASYVTAAQIEQLRKICQAHGVDCRQFWMNRLCLNTVLNENIAGRRGAYKVETDSEGDEETQETVVEDHDDLPTAPSEAAVQEEKSLNEVEPQRSKEIPVGLSVVGPNSEGDQRVSDAPADLGGAPEGGEHAEDGQQKEVRSEADKVSEDSGDVSVNRDKDTGSEEEQSQQTKRLVESPAVKPPEPKARPSKSYIVVPLSSEEEENEKEESTLVSATRRLPVPVSPPRRKRGRPRKDPASAAYVKKRPRSPAAADDNEDSDADWDPSLSPSTTSFKRRRKRGPGRPRKQRPKDEECMSDTDEEEDERNEKEYVDERRTARLAGTVGCNFADCGELFTSLGMLAHHLDSVHREASILRCPICGRYFTLSQPYDQHLAENHLPRIVEEEEDTAPSALPNLSQNHIIGR